MELDVRLSKADGPWAAGERLTGDVRVVADNDIQRASVSLVVGVACTSVATSPNDDDSRHRFLDEHQRTVLHQGPVAAGTRSLPFQVEVPPGPYSYDGRTIRLGWYLQAVLEPDDGRPVTSARVPFTVVPASTATPGADGSVSERVAFTESPKGSIGCLAFALLVLAAGITGVWVGLRRDASNAAGFSLLVAGLGIALILVNMYQFLVARRFQSVAGWIGNRFVHPGERVPCGLTFQINRPAEVEAAGITLVATELIRVKRGRTPTGLNANHVLCEERVDLPLPSTHVPARVPVTVQGMLSVPAGAPLSFDQVKDFGGGMALAWTAEFRVTIRNWPDWVRRETIIVVPPDRA